MQQFLDEIKATPGVIGSSLYSTQKGIVASNLPKIFKAESQKRIGSVLQRVFKLNETVRLDVNSFEIQYEEALMLVKRLCNNSALIIICEPDAKVHLINMAVGMLVSEMLSNMEDCEKIPILQPVDSETVLSGPLSHKLSQMKRALAKSIGPVAGITLKKSIAEWLKLEEPGNTDLRKLAEILLAEIDDNASRQEFIADIKKII